MRCNFPIILYIKLKKDIEAKDQETPIHNISRHYRTNVTTIYLLIEQINMSKTKRENASRYLIKQYFLQAIYYFFHIYSAKNILFSFINLFINNNDLFKQIYKNIIFC